MDLFQRHVHVIVTRRSLIALQMVAKPANFTSAHDSVHDAFVKPYEICHVYDSALTTCIIGIFGHLF
jgi:hypothetical protein